MALPQGSASRSSGGGSSKGGQGGIPYIKAENLSKEKQEAKILAARLNDQRADGSRNFSDLVLKIAFKGTAWLYGLKFNNPNFAELRGAFGGEENDWVNKKFYLFLEEDDFTGKNWIRTEAIHPTKEAAAPASRRSQ